MPRRSDTPGVRLVARQRSDGLTWYCRWLDPWSDRWRDENLNALDLVTDEERQAWAAAKYESLRHERQEARAARAAGAPPVVTLRAAMERYLEDCAGRLRALTAAHYRVALERFSGWCRRHGVATGRDLTASALWQYRSWTMGSREWKRSTRRRHLMEIKAALSWWRRAGFTPQLTGDAIADSFAGLSVPQPEVRCLRPVEVRAILAAAVAYPDPRASALVALALLTGCRLGELETLQWHEVDLDAPPAGEIRLAVGEDDPRTKTHRARVIDLAVSSTARDLFAALPRIGPYVLGGSAPLSRGACSDRWLAAAQVIDRSWSWRHARQTTASYLVCAPSIFGAASLLREARQLGHGTQVAERCYVGTLRAIPRDATTLEAAMEAEAEFAAVVARQSARVVASTG